MDSQRYVHHFFASIDHDLLKRKLKALLDKRGVDPQIYDLLCVYINTTDGCPSATRPASYSP